MPAQPLSPTAPYRIGVDGGGTKTELILVDDRGEIVAHHLAPGCNPSIAGPAHARETLIDALHALAAKSPLCLGAERPTQTLLCMAGAPEFWQETAQAFTVSKEFGAVASVDDSIPVLELATGGRPGLVLHGGTGSFVAARDPSGKTHYAGGLGWRFGDEGSGHEIGRLAIARALLELQNVAEHSPVSRLVAERTGAHEARPITRWFYQHPEPNRQIASLAPDVLALAEQGDTTAREIICAACLPLLGLAERVAGRFFPGTALGNIATGLSGPILRHSVVHELFSAKSELRFGLITEPPIEGVRRLLARS